MAANQVNKLSENKDPEEIFVIPLGTPDIFLVCNPLLSVFSLVNKSALTQLRRYMDNRSLSRRFSKELSQLAKLLTDVPENRPDDPDRPFTPMFLGFVPSRACNMSCRYCDFGSGGDLHQTMDLQMAGSAVRWYADFLQRRNFQHMEIHFFGGEPTVSWDLVETAIHTGRLLAGKYNLAPHFEISTNGCFDPAYARFVGDYFDTVVLSLDGFEKTHNRHRPINDERGSFDTVCQSAYTLSRSPTELCLRCCVTDENVSKLVDITDWFCNAFQPAIINFEPLTPNSRSKSANIRLPDPYDFACNFFDAQQHGKKYGVQVVYAASESNEARASFCPVGNDALIITPDGRISSCYLRESSWRQKGLDLSVGKVDINGRVTVDHKAMIKLRTVVNDKPKCTNCFCRWSCAGGCHVNNTWPGCSHEYDDFCISTRLLSTCRWLDELDYPNLAEDLLKNRKAMGTLAAGKTDRLEDFV